MQTTLARHCARFLSRPLLALILSATASALATAATAPHEEITLENGMRVLLLPHPGSGMIASNVFVGAGSTREEARFAGSSHFLEHVLFNGTTHRTQEELYAAADRIGAYNNATTRQEYTHYMMVAPAERLADALDIQADMLLHSTLPNEKFEKERGIVLEELSKDKDDPNYQLQRSLDNLLYGEGSNFARPVLGTEETIRDLPRASVEEYYKRQYVPSNMRLILMGDFERDAALEIVRQKFLVEPDHGRASDTPQSAPACVLAAPDHGRSQRIDAPNTVVELVVALHASSPEDEALLSLLAHIAGGTKSGRLERALNASPEVPHNEASASVIYRQGQRQMVLQTRLSADGSPLEAARRMITTVRSLTDIKKGELTAARTTLLSQEVSQIEKLHYYALFQGDRLWHMAEGYTPRFLATIEATDTQTLAEAATRFLADAQLQVVAGGPGVETGNVALGELEPSPDQVKALQSSGSETAPDIQRRRPSALASDEAPAVLQLDNGLTVIHAAAASTRMFAIHLLVKDRSLREPDTMRGIADLLHRSFPSVIREKDGGPSRLDHAGGTLKVADSQWIPYDDYYTTPLYSFVRLECIDEYYEEALSLLARMLTGPYDDEAALEDARSELLSAIERAGSRPGNRTRARLNELVFGDNPRSRSVTGSEETLSLVTTQNINDFSREYLSPDNLVLAIVGNVPRDEAVASLKKTLGQLRRAPSTGSVVGSLPPPLTEVSTREEIEGGGNQSSLRMARIMELAPEDRWALLVAARIASNHMQQDLRETRGLAYSLGISAALYGNRAAVFASMGTRPENLEEAEAGMQSYLAGGKLDVTADEIETAVNKHLSRMRMRRITSMGQAFTLCRDYFLRGGIDYTQREAEGLAAVTREDVHRAAARYLSDAPTITVIAR